MTDLQTTWFFLITVLLIGYSILDGFDLGVGFWYLFTRKDEHRRVLLRAIGPVWDGNEVWLLTGGGALFAAFPHVYATVFSGFYLALMLVLAGLIFRAVAIEFRNQEESPGWRKSWDVAFGVGSIIPALLLGVAFGNILRGLPLDDAMNFTGSFFTLLNPYALLIGLVGLSFFATHGALYTVLKADGELAETAAVWARKTSGVYLVLAVVGAIASAAFFPHLRANHAASPALWVVPVVALAAVVLVGVFARKGEYTRAFVASSVSIAGLMLASAVALFPNLVPGLGAPELSLTVFNASSSALTLKTMLILAIIGVPIVLAYTWWIYRVFSGKVVLAQEDHY